MNREKLEEWLKYISTPTGLSYSGDQTLSNSEVDTILEYVDNLQSKIDKTIEYIEENIDLDMDDFTKIDTGCEILKILDLDKYNEFLKEE